MPVLFRGEVVGKAVGAWLDDVDVGEIAGVELLEDMGPGGDGIAVAHALRLVRRR